jgi:hypothetical protein
MKEFSYGVQQQKSICPIYLETGLAPPQTRLYTRARTPPNAL